MMSTNTFIVHVASHAGIPIGHAERVTRVVLSGLGSYLTSAVRQLVADELPAPLGMALLDVSGVAVPLEERVLEVQIAGRAHELVASVFCVLAEELSTRTLLALRADMPPWLARLLATPPARSAARSATRPPEPRRNATLATDSLDRHPVLPSEPGRAATPAVRPIT